MLILVTGPSGGIIAINNRFFNMKICCVFSADSPHRGDSTEYTQYTIFYLKKIITLNYPKFAAIGFCCKGRKNEFETAVVNESSVFEPLKYYCTCILSAPIINNHRNQKDHV